MNYEIEHLEVGKVLFFRNNRAKRIIISVKPEYVRVVIPRRQSFKNAQNFLNSKINWVLNQTKRIKKEIKKSEALPKLDEQKARYFLKNRLKELGKKYNYDYNKISFRKQKTRWGSCSSKNNISLNMKLMHLPEFLIDYVLIHELVHTSVKNHGKSFWEELNQIMPNAKQVDQKLRNYNYCLF